MSKVVSCNCPTKPDVFTDTSIFKLDTLAQVRETGTVNPLYPLVSKDYTPNQKNLGKRSSAKCLSDTFVYKLVDLVSPLTKSYWQSYWCTRIVSQSGSNLKTRYCNQRWCLVCNRIRAAKLMGGYSLAIDQMVDPQFVTLTRPNVKGKRLRLTIEDMQLKFVRSKDVVNYQCKENGLNLVGIRKVECTYNAERDDYHPHLHCIVDGKEQADLLVAQWLKQNPKAKPYAQDVRPCNDPIELFKYFTKMVSKDGHFYAKQMDIVFRAMYRKRVFQPFGGIKKHSEDVEVKEQTECDWKLPQETLWEYKMAGKFTDWYNEHAEPLTNIEIPQKTLEYIEKISNPKLSNEPRKRQTESKANSTGYVRA